MLCNPSAGLIGTTAESVRMLDFVLDFGELLTVQVFVVGEGP